MWFSTDRPSESFRENVALLAIDKLVLGALIAIAVVIYDLWKTDEVRKYADAHQRVELAFKRAEYIKDVLPVLLDETNDVMVRAQSFASLVETSSISPEAAIRFADRLLLDDVLRIGQVDVTPFHRLNPQYGRTLQNTIEDSSEEAVLANAITVVMPAGVPWLLDAYRKTVLKAETQTRDSTDTVGDSSDLRADVLAVARAFWARLFIATVERTTDKELAFLESSPLVDRHLTTIDEICKESPVGTSGSWFDRSNKTLKTVAAIQLLRDNVEHRDDEAARYLLPYMNPSASGTDIRYATTVVELVTQNGVASSELSLEALNFAVQMKESRKEPSTASEQSRASQESALLQEVSNLLYRAVRYQDVSDALEPLLLEELRWVITEVDRAPRQRYPGDTWQLETTLVRIVGATRGGERGRSSDEVDRQLERLYDLGRERLLPRGFHDFVNDWERSKAH